MTLLGSPSGENLDDAATMISLSKRAVAVFNFSDRWMRQIVIKAAPPDFDVRFIDDPNDEPRVRELLAKADFLVTISLPASWTRALVRCRLVQLQGVGYDAVDLPALADAGIPLALTPEGTVSGVAEHTILLVLSLYRRLPALQDHFRRGEFDRLGWRPQCRSLRGRTFGIVGLGRIGRRVAHLASAFEAPVIYNDLHRAPADVERDLAAAYCSFDELLSESDIVSVHTPLTPSTRGMFGVREFARMKEGALFINTSRGETYDMDALAAALASGHLGGAGLDVFNPQPPPPEHPIRRLPNVIATPHMAAGTVESHLDKARAQFENFRHILRGEPPRNRLCTDKINC
jgi:phosphoglycerate dehydrogenase-like enzyme